MSKNLRNPRPSFLNRDGFHPMDSAKFRQVDITERRVFLASAIPYNMVEKDFCTPWLLSRAYPALSYYLGGISNVAHELMEALLIKEVTVEDVTDARSILYTELSKKLFTRKIGNCANFIRTEIAKVPSDAIVSREYFCRRLGITPTQCKSENYPLQKLLWLQIRGNVFVWDYCLVDSSWLTMVKNLNDLNNNEYQNIPCIDFVDIMFPSKNIYDFTCCSSETILGFIETISMAEEETMCSAIIGAAIIVLSLITRDVHTVDSWLHDKIAHIETVCTGIDLRYVTSDLMQDFLARYPLYSIRKQNVHFVIQALFSWSDEKSAEVLNWMIEEAIMSRIANIFFFAEAMTERNFNFMYWLMTKIPMIQFTELAIQIAWILHDRYSVISQLQVPIDKYSQIVYIGKHTYLRKKFTDNPFFKPKNASCRYLDSLVNLIYEFNRKAINEEEFVDNLKKICPVGEESQSYDAYIVDDLTLKAGAIYYLLQKLVEANKNHAFCVLKRNNQMGYKWTTRLPRDILYALYDMDVAIHNKWIQDHWLNDEVRDKTVFEILSRGVS